VFAGNELPNWADNSGSLQRRILIAQFNEMVGDSTDTTLGRKLEEEVPAIMKKAATAYIEAASRWGDTDIWSKLPEMFREQKRIMAESSNSLIGFLQSEKVRLVPGKHTRMQEFVAAFRTFCEEFGFPKVAWKHDFYMSPFRQFKLEKKKGRLEWPVGSGLYPHSGFVIGAELVVDGDGDQGGDTQMMEGM
jgi:phage/plasmid-associated DNA primase